MDALSSPKEELLKLQTLLKEDFCGVIWLSKEKLREDLPYFSALDYFVDGGLQQLINNRKESSGNLVLTKNFGHLFFIAQYSASDELKEVINSLDILGPDTTKNYPKVLLLGDVPLQLEEGLKKKAPHLKFEILIS